MRCGGVGFICTPTASARQRTPCAVSKGGHKRNLSAAAISSITRFCMNWRVPMLRLIHFTSFFNGSHPRTRAGRKKSKYGPSRRGTFIDICIWWCASLCVWCLRVLDAKNKKENCTCRHARHVLWFLPFGDDLTVASDSSPVPRIKYSTNSFFVRDVHFNGPADAADENVLTVGAGGIEWPVRMKRNSVGPPLKLMLIVSLLLRTGIIRKVDGVHTEHAKVLSTHPRPLAGRRLDRARL